MKIREFYERRKEFINKTIEMGSNPIYDECGLCSEGLRAKIVNIRLARDDSEVFEIVFDYSEWEEYNKQFEMPDFFDVLGQAEPTLTWSQSGTKRADKREILSLWMGNDTVQCTEEIEEFFEIIEEDSPRKTALEIVAFLKKEIEDAEHILETDSAQKRSLLDSGSAMALRIKSDHYRRLLNWIKGI